MTKEDFELAPVLGNTIKIVPIDKVPYADRVLTVNELRSDGILYGVSTTSDGYVMPYSWIKSFSIVGGHA